MINRPLLIGLKIYYIKCMSDHIIITTEQTTGRIVINRPSALNALSAAMCRSMIDGLVSFAADDGIDRVLITAADGRSFCAGGDVRSIIGKIRDDFRHAMDYFTVEYSLDVLIGYYPKPLVVLADGLTMGGGAGVLLNSSLPVMTESMDFAMPETAIGLFPDVGASVFLRRAPGAVGLFLGLTGWRIGMGDMAALGILSRAVASDTLDSLIASVIGHSDPETLDDLIDTAAIHSDTHPIFDARDWIDGHFSQPDLASIRASLAGDSHPMAEACRHALDSRSPLSLAVTHRLLTGEVPHSLIDALHRDYVLACRVTSYPDFAEGVRAALIDKDGAPDWMAGITPSLINGIFSGVDRPPFVVSSDISSLLSMKR